MALLKSEDGKGAGLFKIFEVSPCICSFYNYIFTGLCYKYDYISIKEFDVIPTYVSKKEFQSMFQLVLQSEVYWYSVININIINLFLYCYYI